MSKIICDICGTTYPSSAECCPICGCTNALDNDPDDFLEETSTKASASARASRKREIFDFDEVNTENDPEEVDEEEDYDEEEEETRHNTGVVILLTVMIVVLLGAAAFIFFRYFMPNMNQEETVPTTVAVQETQLPAETTLPTIPCQQMVMTNAGVAHLNAEGQQFLLHIKALPENTTDKIIYTSGDTNIATVTEDGKITAVSEGETVIYISCGEHSIDCPVIVEYVEETVPPTTEAPVEAETEEASGSTEPEQTVSGEEESSEETKATEAVNPETSGNEKKDTPINSNIKLKLKRTDIQLGVYYSFQLELDCDLDPEDVTWTSEHPHIAKVDEQGNVTAVKSGTTSITAKYGDQEVQCMVRCIWY